MKFGVMDRNRSLVTAYMNARVPTSLSGIPPVIPLSLQPTCSKCKVEYQTLQLLTLSWNVEYKIYYEVTLPL